MDEKVKEIEDRQGMGRRRRVRGEGAERRGERG